MSPFKGFPDGKMPLIRIPGPFFRQVLPQIDHLGELKVTLQAFWLLEHLEGNFRYLRQSDFLQDATFMRGLGRTRKEAQANLIEALGRAVARGSLVSAVVRLEKGEETLYFLNSPRGRAAVQAIERGEWRLSGDAHRPVEIREDLPNIFRLYEENIGPLTPMIAERLREAEETYPASWIQDAIRIAVENNARNWAYVRAILDRWQIEGRDERKDRQDTEKARRKYIEGEYADYIEH